MIDKTQESLLISRCVIFDDRKAYASLIRKYEPFLRRFFLNITSGNKMLSDDLSQDTFIKMYTNLKNFKGVSSFSTWLYRIAYNTYYDYLRSIKQTEEIEIDCRITIPDSTIISLEKKIDINKAMENLNLKERTAISLFFINDFPIEKISSIMQIPSGSVKVLLSRGKTKMAYYLSKNGYQR